MARPRKPPTRFRAFTGRFMVGHLIAYPVGFLTAVAAMPLAMLIKKRELMDAGPEGATIGLIRDATRDLSLSATEAAQVELVLRFCFWLGLFTLSLVHLWTLPWAVAAARAVHHPEREPQVQRAYRGFSILTAATLILVALGGAVGWIWVLAM